MTALNLTPQDTNYLNCSLINQQLTQNKDILTISSVDISFPTDAPGYFITDGTGRGQLSGQINIISNPAVNMELFRLPIKYKIPTDYYFPIVVLGAGYTPNAISIKTISGVIVVTLINLPTVGDIVILDSAPFLLNSYN